jgi:hypothetical protein
MPSVSRNRHINAQGQGGLGTVPAGRDHLRSSREQTLPHWRVVRRTSTEIVDDETFQHFGDAWAYAQPDPENGIHHYINKAHVLEEFQRGARYLTTAYEGNVRIDLVKTAANPPVVSRIVT